MCPRFAHCGKVLYILSGSDPVGRSACHSGHRSWSALCLHFPPHLPVSSPSLTSLPHSFPEGLGIRLNSIEFSSCVSLFSCTFQPHWLSSVYCGSLSRGSPGNASISFSPVLAFPRKMTTVTCLHLYSICLFRIREYKP